ncbi:MAG: hypothetical protein ACR2G7_06965 [Acidimicrobiales bacterium]
MSDRFGISGGGRNAEELFRQMTGAAPAERAAQGDALLDGHPVEVKRATSVTLNQVRAVKYLPIVVHYSPTDEWYVIPAHVVIAGVSQKLRGQHTENPFESATLSLKKLHAWKIEDPSRLREATLEAIAASDEYPELRASMEDVLRESRGLADSSLERIRALLNGLGLGT